MPTQFELLLHLIIIMTNETYFRTKQHCLIYLDLRSPFLYFDNKLIKSILIMTYVFDKGVFN